MHDLSMYTKKETSDGIKFASWVMITVYGFLMFTIGLWMVVDLQSDSIAAGIPVWVGPLILASSILIIIVGLVKSNKFI